MYLEHLFDTALVLARKNNIKVNVIHDEVMNIIRKNIYCLEGKSGNAYLSHSVVLALGHTQSNNYDYLATSKKYLASPYQLTNIFHQIPNDASIAIIGSRLSAIDTAIALDECGHRGKMAFISRNGYLPSVRPNGVCDYKLKIITAKRINEISRLKQLKLSDVVNMIAEEVSLAAGANKKISEWFDRPHDAELYLENEISKLNCQDTIIWQSIMIAINHVIELIWHKFSERDKKIFIKRYRSRWMAYRVGIPYQNAIKILSQLKEGRLLSIQGLKCIQFDPVIEKFVVQSSSQKTFDYVINATGFCSSINQTKSTLIMNMKKNGLLKSNQFGGMDVEFITSRIKDANGAIQEDLYAIGNLTEGTYFFTSVLELNIKHANTVSSLILDDFKDQSNLLQSYAR